MNLPTITESLKTVDNKFFYKIADISQMVRLQLCIYEGRRERERRIKPLSFHFYTIIEGQGRGKEGAQKGQRRCQRRGQGARLKSALAVSEFYECRRFYVHAHTSSCLSPTPSSSQVDFSQPAKELRPPRDDGGPVSQLGDCKWKLRAWRDFVTSHFIGYILASICYCTRSSPTLH